MYCICCLVAFEHSNRTTLITSRLTRACHRPFNALSLSDASLKDAPNLHCLSLYPGTEMDWTSSIVHRLLHFQQDDKSKTRCIYPRLTLTSHSTGKAEDVWKWKRTNTLLMVHKNTDKNYIMISMLTTL